LLQRGLALLGLATAAAGAAGTVAAQDSPDSLTISYGQTAEGKLTTDNLTLQDGSLFQKYEFVGRVGDAVTIWLNSSDFNATLLLADSKDSVLVTDDNTGGACNAHIQTALPTTGVYSLFVTTAEAGELGQYYLTLQRGTYPPERPDPCVGWTGLSGSITVGDTVSGALTPMDRQLPNDSTYYQVWQLWNPTAQPFTVEVSAPFDGALILVRGLTEVVAFDDDGGPGCNPRIPYVPDDDRPLRIIVDSRNRQLGEFQLTVAKVLHPTVDEPPCVPSEGS
jgi:hypothetical protein